MVDAIEILRSQSLSPAEIQAVVALVDMAAEADGLTSLNEAGLLHLRHRHPGVEHLLARRDGQLLGYAQRNGGPVATGELVVAPVHRGRGVGSALLAGLIERGPIRVWAVGNRPAAQALARRHGLVAARILLIMERSLDEPVPGTRVPDDVVIRTFRVGADEEEWLQLNSRVFAEHPEQGAIRRSDLNERLAEPWFDAQGFFLAVSGGRMIGFHWTKQHEDQLGEVYVLGVDPLDGGRGLGRALLAVGLTHLKRRGNAKVQLYVESDNEAGIALYSAYGFRVARRDVMYASP
jgi:mycothiol synthase